MNQIYSIHPTLRCPCCGELMRTWTQTYPAKYNLPDRQYADCGNPDCAKYHADSLTVEEHQARQTTVMIDETS